MSQQPNHRQQPPNARGHNRLGPRPVEQPPVDPTQAAAFGRPAGVRSAFAPRADRERNGSFTLVAPPPEALTKAFSRPPGTGELLQRPPGDSGGVPPATDPEQALWSDNGGGWRDPGAGAALGPPAVSTEEKPEPVVALPQGARLSARELLFGRRLSTTGTLALAGIVLLIAAVGGVVGRLTAEDGSVLTSSGVTLAPVSPAVERPPGSVSDVAKRVLPSVVSIEVVLGDKGGTGSGVVIDGQGYVLTNNHVVDMAVNAPAAKVEAIFSDGSRVPARIVGADPKTDLAVIKVEVRNPTVAQVGRSADLQVGDAVIAVGAPHGLAGTVTTGIVSAKNRAIRLDTDLVINAIQTDAAINPGNSGGALIDARGALIGINTAIYSTSKGSIGLGFAIPMDEATQIAQALIRTGSVKHADMGVDAKSVTADTSSGAQVQNVRQGGAAAAAGIQEGDVITKVGERAIANADDLVVSVRQRKIDEAVPVQIVRQGRQLTLTVTLKSD
ncbi:trypsin-like peptidase domain-containing protein [Allokutzneria multivorans]|uniref:Trypsin-like peptidase domain-containing protein n=1 Tax=Allokutzneria multivorans TaxID=1142134 RepID=A0ABP7U8K1_9PSEU